MLFKQYPTSILYNGLKYEFKLCFRDVIQFVEKIDTENKLDIILKYSTIFFSDIIKELELNEIIEMMNMLIIFCIEQNDNNKVASRKSKGKPLDLKENEDYLISDFLRFYNINLLTDYLDWRVFTKLIKGLPPESVTVQNILNNSK